MKNPVTTAEGSGDLEKKADDFVAALLSLDPKEVKARDQGKSAVEDMALDLQRKAAQQSELLKQPLKKLSEKSEDGGEVAKALIRLKMEVEELDPGKFNLDPGWLTRFLGKLPGVGSPLKRYFTKFESAQTVIAATIRALEGGRDQLGRDNITLSEDQKRMREMAQKLERAVQLGQLIDQKLQSRLEREIEPGSERHRFVSEELLFPLRQRIMDLQQQLAVNQQGVLATELVIRNNQELIRGVNRSLNVTVTALQVAATVAMALADQRIVLDKINSVNQTTSDLIAGTAARLRTQGAEIQKQATSSQINMESLKSAFADLKAAMDDISKFRSDALPKMHETVKELEKITTDAGQTIQRLEQGNRSRPQITVDVE